MLKPNVHVDVNVLQHLDIGRSLLRNYLLLFSLIFEALVSIIVNLSPTFCEHFSSLHPEDERPNIELILNKYSLINGGLFFLAESDCTFYF